MCYHIFMTFIQDFRQPALDVVNEGHTKVEACRVFKMRLTTLKK